MTYYGVLGIHNSHYEIIDDGSMNAAKRSESLEAIKDNPKVKVILISTKAGNSGKKAGKDEKQY